MGRSLATPGMAIRFRKKQWAHRFAALLLAAAFSLAPLSSHAVGAAESFADGNRLFRDDLYWAALLRYRQAAEAGMDTPLLHYNVGIAHYKARQYGRAHQALLKASQSSRLRVVSHYNMGINAYAAGTNEEALRWLRRARDQEQSRRIRELAIRAIARIRNEEPKVEPIVVQARGILSAKKFTNFDIYARVGFGYDNNVYRTPADPYLDLSNRNQPVIINPVLQEGMFNRVRLGAKYSIKSFEHESFFGRYRMTGIFHSEQPLNNADEYSHELAFGSEYERKDENRESIVFSAFTVAQHRELYFDPDDGTERTSNGINIADRLSTSGSARKYACGSPGNDFQSISAARPNYGTTSGPSSLPNTITSTFGLAPTCSIDLLRRLYCDLALKPTGVIFRTGPPTNLTEPSRLAIRLSNTFMWTTA